MSTRVLMRNTKFHLITFVTDNKLFNKRTAVGNKLEMSLNWLLEQLCCSSNINLLSQLRIPICFTDDTVVRCRYMYFCFILYALITSDSKLY